MFRRVTNADLLNKIIELENKMDIMNIDFRENYMTLEGCCDCKVKELIIYKEIKTYFENKFHDILENLNDIKNIDDKLNTVLENHKDEILNNFENIISKLEIIKDNVKENTIDECNQIKKIVSEHITSHKVLEDKIIDKINEQLTAISNKIDLLYYENENIKHQLLLEEDIRKYEEEITNISNIVNKTIEYINNITL